MSPDVANMTASASSFYSAMDARIIGLLFVASVAALILVLASSTLFNRFRTSGRWIGRAIYYVALGLPIFIAGWTLYTVGYWIGEMLAVSSLEPVDIGKAVAFVVGLGVLGYLGEYTGKKIAANIAEAREERAETEESAEKT